ncbi:MAG: universal stress protein [Phycisphaerales bacterium]|nr:universal stress protein [Planctomycetota bacterium]MCH8508104.1 universal stress protein [Phycisphaerales bacterium]
MTGPVVVATDFSPSARSALAHAARIAGQRKVPLHAITVVDSEHVASLASSVPFPKDAVEKQVIERARLLLHREVDEADLGVKPEIHAAIGRPGRGVEDLCERTGASLLVMGYHGKSERSRGPGSVASRCVRHAPCDVLLVRRGRSEPFRRVVVGVDLSEQALGVVARGAELVSPDNGELVLLHAHSNPFDSLAFAGFGLDQADQYDEYAGSLRDRLSRIAEGLGGAVKGGVRAELVIDSNYGRAIAAWCHDYEADLAVVGTLGKPGLRYWLLGSTAEGILRETGSAVLAVRGEG